jgi:cholesterol oxidase
MDTIRTNLVEALCAEKYDVWLLDYRASIALREACFEQFNADDVAMNDYPAAVDEVLRLTKVRGAKDVQLVVHCFGSTTLFMSLLGGYLEPDKVRCVVVSQIATHLVTSLDSRVKAGLYAGNWLYWLGFPYLNAYTDTSARFRQRAWNFLLRFLPLHKDERCRSDVCHRISYAYSLLYEHEQLDTKTHDALHEMFGVANITALRHLAEMTRQGKLVDARGRDAYIPHMRDRLRIPMLFIHGADNYCFKPESTKITLKLLEDLQAGDPPDERVRYERVEIPRYGHIDCIFGKNAADDVFPEIWTYLNRHP